MALVIMQYVVCDVCGKPGSDPVEGPHSARHYAEANGFTSRPSPYGAGRRRRDYCPEHKTTSYGVRAVSAVRGLNHAPIPTTRDSAKQRQARLDALWSPDGR